jgi:hypothetical protein
MQLAAAKYVSNPFMQPTTTNCQKQVKNTTADKSYGFVQHQSIPIFIDTKHASRAF